MKIQILFSIMGLAQFLTGNCARLVLQNASQLSLPTILSESEPKDAQKKTTKVECPAEPIAEETLFQEEIGIPLIKANPDIFPASLFDVTCGIIGSVSLLGAGVCGCDCGYRHGSSLYILCGNVAGSNVACTCVYTSSDYYYHPCRQLKNNSESALMTNKGNAEPQPVPDKAVCLSNLVTSTFIVGCTFNEEITLKDQNGCEIKVTTEVVCQIDCFFIHGFTTYPYGICGEGELGNGKCFCVPPGLTC